MFETAVKEGENSTPTTPARPPLTEQYRPRTWADVVGQEKVVQRIRALARRGLAGRAFWVSGQSGTGKTTLARLIAAEVADDFSTHEVDAAALTIAQLRELEREMSVAGGADRAAGPTWSTKPTGSAKCIPEADIRPRENVFTYHAWQALGRQVRKGEHGVKVLTFVALAGKDNPPAAAADGTTPTKNRGERRPWSATVFHVSQTDPLTA